MLSNNSCDKSACLVIRKCLLAMHFFYHINILHYEEMIDIWKWTSVINVSGLKLVKSSADFTIWPSVLSYPMKDECLYLQASAKIQMIVAIQENYWSHNRLHSHKPWWNVDIIIQFSYILYLFMSLLISPKANYKVSTSIRIKQNKQIRKQKTKQGNFYHSENNKSSVRVIMPTIMQCETNIYTHTFILKIINIYCCLLGYDSKQFQRWLLIFSRNLLLSSSKWMHGAGFSATLVNTYETTWSCKLEDHNLNPGWLSWNLNCWEGLTWFETCFKMCLRWRKHTKQTKFFGKTDQFY